jgi:catechol 2,3-dioxygenase-like lactoylglutathione lyase family enzyme
MIITHVELGVANLERSVDFYSRLGFPVQSTMDSNGRRVAILGPGPAVLRLVEVGPDGRPTEWSADDLQCGIRHFGMKVSDVDEWASRLKAAGVPFTMEPFDAFGDVRIAFFFDPDGAYLELVQGYVRHNNLWSAELAQQEVDGDRGRDGSPRFDHVAITVPDLDEALAFYRDRLGFGGIGQLVRPPDERGFLITNLRAGPTTTLEIFSFGAPTVRRSGVDEPNRLGLRSIGVRGVDVDKIGVGDVPLSVGT